ncbi:hypothetical protein GCM10011379_18250 [Filimonas zeae]|uniref:Uncharacterized protein n=2 Tax=Filimonas zeae TaxID=1737353 RepID=A0A917IVV0_9BACT|nr:hypothetical protein GCM10011379_18250 [Filimonas zeae]
MFNKAFEAAAQYLPLFSKTLKKQPIMINYKPVLLAALVMCCYSTTRAQTFTGMKIALSRRGETLNAFSFTTGDITFFIDSKGGLEYQLDAGNTAVVELDYYGSFHEWEAGKLKSVNDIIIEYYDAFKGALMGKLKKIGNVEITYYDNFDGQKNGKLKSVGSIVLDYYDNFQAEKTGKLKSVSSLNLDYYDSFNAAKSGKLKTTGSVQLDYYDNFYPEKAGRLKSVNGRLPNVQLAVEQ